MNIANYLIIISACISFSIACLLAFKGKRTVTNLFLILAIFSNFFWITTFFLYRSGFVNQFMPFQISIKLSFIAAHFMLSFFLLFALGFTEKSSKVITPISFLLSIPMLLFGWILFFRESWLIKDYLFLEGGRLAIDPGPFFLYEGSYVITIMAFTVTLLGLKAISAQGEYKKQLTYILSGATITGFISFFVTIFLTLIGKAQAYWLAPVASVFIIGVISYMALKYDFMDIKANISRVFSHFLVIGLIIFISTILSYLPLSYLSVTIITAFSGLFWMFFGHWLREKIQTTTEQKWISDFCDYDNVFDNICEKLMKVIDSNEAISVTAKELLHCLNLRSCYFINQEITTKGNKKFQLFDIHEHAIKKFTEHDSLISFMKSKTIVSAKELPVEAKETCIQLNLKNPLFLSLHCEELYCGLIILDQKISQANFNQKDIAFLKHIVNHLQVVLERALPYEKIKAKLKKKVEIGTIAKTVITLNHEINSPLTAILISAQQLSRTSQDNADYKKLTDIILYGTKRVKTILAKLAKVKEPIDAEYLAGTKMIKISDN